MSTSTVYDQEALPAGVVPITDDVRVYPDEALGWGYLCKDSRCSLNSSRRLHGLAGYATRAVAIDAATAHVTAIRQGRGVIA